MLIPVALSFTVGCAVPGGRQRSVQYIWVLQDNLSTTHPASTMLLVSFACSHLHAPNVSSKVWHVPVCSAYHSVALTALRCAVLRYVVLYHCITACDQLSMCVGDLASSEWWERKDLVPPEPSPPENLQSVLADVFFENPRHQQNPFPVSQPLPDLHLPKTAPPNSLLVRQACLLSLSPESPAEKAY